MMQDSQPQTFLASTQDLLARFHLHSAYHTHVQPPSSPSQLPPSTVAPKAIPHDPPPETDDKKKKNSYRHLIRNVPGKHSTKKDDYLTTTMQVPPKQRIAIVEFDARTQRDAFTVSADGLRSVCNLFVTLVLFNQDYSGTQQHLFRNLLRPRKIGKSG